MVATVWRRADHVEMPWRNGGGSTLEVARWPREAGLEDFDWRLSFARVGSSGPFSAFPGVDRVLTLVRGDGMRLTLGPGEDEDGRSARAAGSDGPSGRVVDLPLFEPFAFPGETTVSAEVGAPTLDVNVMTRRARVTAHVVSHRLSHEPRRVDPVTATVLLAVLDGRADLGPGEPTLEELDVAALDAPVDLTGTGVVQIVTLTAAGSGGVPSA